MLFKFSIIDDMENSSDHLLVLIGVNLPINEVSCELHLSLFLRLSGLKRLRNS